MAPSRQRYCAGAGVASRPRRVYSGGRTRASGADAPARQRRTPMMTAVVLHEADDMRVERWPVPEPGEGEVLLKVNVASICMTDVKVLHRRLQGQPDGPFIMGHEYAGTVAALGPGVDEFGVGDRVTVEIHAGCGQCKRCRMGMYTSCLNYGLNYGDRDKGHRANGFTTDGGFAEYAVNNINTL